MACDGICFVSLLSNGSYSEESKDCSSRWSNIQTESALTKRVLVDTQTKRKNINFFRQNNNLIR